MTKDVGIAHRREQVQRLLIRGLSAREISNSVSPPVSEITVNRDIHWIKRMNEKWWQENSHIKVRMMRYLKERIDAISEISREAWLVVYDAKDDLRMKVSGLNIVLGAEKTLSELMGFAGLSVIELEVQDRMEKMDVELAELRRLAGIAERNYIQA